jgi:hypothetical protein
VTSDLLRLLVLTVAGWLRLEQQAAIVYLQAENKVLREHVPGKVQGPDHPDVASSRQALGDMLESGAKQDEALELAEAAWTRHRAPDIPGEVRAETAFLLARLLWPDREDRERARALAQTAREAYRQADGIHDEPLAKIEAWLRTHP